MTTYSELIVFFLMLPVLMQIIIPLLMLIGFGLARALRLIFNREAQVNDLPADGEIGEKLQLSGN